MVMKLRKAGRLYYFIITCSLWLPNQFWVAWCTQRQLHPLISIFAKFYCASQTPVISLKICFLDLNCNGTGKKKKRYRNYKKVSIRYGNDSLRSFEMVTFLDLPRWADFFLPLKKVF